MGITDTHVETQIILDQLIHDIEAICRPLSIPVLRCHEEIPSQRITVEVTPEPKGVIRVIVYSGGIVDDAGKFGEHLDGELIRLFDDRYKIVGTVRGENFGNTWRVVAKAL